MGSVYRYGRIIRDVDTLRPHNREARSGKMQGKPRKNAHGKHGKKFLFRVFRVVLFRGSEKYKLVQKLKAM
jgi:hypothetical protein